MRVNHEDEKILSVDETMNRVRLRPLHWRTWYLSAMGIWMEGYNLFVIGIALPLIKFQYRTTPLQDGIIGASVIIGTIFGAATLGRIADLYGRKKILILNALIVTVFSILAGTSTNLYFFMIFLCMIGLGVGADYPICAAYVAELMPSRIRGRMLIGAFSFQAAGMMTAAIVGFIILKMYHHPSAWRWIISAGSIPALMMTILRIDVPESPRWCIENGQPRQAIRIISKLSTKSDEKINKIVRKEEKAIKKIDKKLLPFSSIFNKEYIRRTILSSVPWFLMDIATYGVGIFTPTIIAFIVADNYGFDYIDHVLFSIGSSAVIYVFLIVGFSVNILIVEKYGRIKLQLIGFLGMTAGLVMLGFSALFQDLEPIHLILLFSGFIIYNFLMNMGPNATTFILPAELYPTKIRATAHGFSASFAKIGAVVGIILIPILISSTGLFLTIILIAGASFLGFITTLIFKVETKGKSLNELSHLEAARTINKRI